MSDCVIEEFYETTGIMPKVIYAIKAQGRTNDEKRYTRVRLFSDKGTYTQQLERLRGLLVDGTKLTTWVGEVQWTEQEEIIGELRVPA